MKEGTLVGGRYRIERTLGDGGYGVVYLATQTAMDRSVALKVLRQDLEADQIAIERFYREAKAASSLSHPNIVRIFDFGVDEELSATYLVMEYVQGRTLEQALRAEGPFSERRAAQILLQVARSLVSAHAADIVHRDLKPANIMVANLSDGEEHVKVLDFGVAKILDADAKRITRTDGPIGTPAYMSPEQVSGKAIDLRSDLYSLGCVLHELVTGEAPYGSEQAVSVMFQHVSDPVPPLPKVLPAGAAPSSALRKLHAALLEKKKEARPTTDAVVRRLAAIVEGRATDGLDPAPTPAAEATLDPGTANLLTREPPPARSRRAYAAFAAVFAATGAIAFSFSFSPDPPPAPVPKPIVQMVELTFDSTPPGAVVSIDGRVFGETPRRLTLPADTSTRTILIAKEGYEAVRQKLVADTSHAIRVMLRPAAKPPEEAKRAPKLYRPQRQLKTTR